MLTALFILARIVANPVCNVFRKQLAQRGVHPLAVIKLSALLSVFLDQRHFQEGRIHQRVPGTLVMIAGALSISLLGKGATP